MYCTTNEIGDGFDEVKTGVIQYSSGEIINNTASNGGGVYAYANCYYSLNEKTYNFKFFGKINNNKADNGGGIYCQLGGMYLKGTTIQENTNKKGAINDSSAIYFGDPNANKEHYSGGSIVFEGETKITGNIFFDKTQYWRTNMTFSWYQNSISIVNGGHYLVYYGIFLQPGWTNSSEGTIGLPHTGAWGMVYFAGKLFSVSFFPILTTNKNVSTYMKKYFKANDDRDYIRLCSGDSSNEERNLWALRVDSI